MTEQNRNTNLEELYPWKDDVTKEGADYEPNDLNNNLMHLKYVHRPKNVAGRNIGDIFWTMRVDESINGAYPCDGGEFMESDFLGENNPYNLLVLGRIPSVTYEEYEQQMAANNGNCGFFALDVENHKFKVPTLHKVSIEATKIVANIGDYIQDQIVNITGAFGADDRMLNHCSGAFSAKYGGFATGSSGSESGCAFNFDASAVVITGDRVKPRTVSLRAMVQLANEVDDAISVESYINCIENATMKGISALNAASGCLTNSQVTNCILSAPDNIKLDINSNGELVLLAGSTVIIPDGLNNDGSRKFLHKTFEQSVIFNFVSDFTSVMSDFMPFVWCSAGKSGGVAVNNCYAGDAAPSGFSGEAYWYDTSNNIIKYAESTGAAWVDGQIAFPVCQLNIEFDGSSYVKYPKSIFNSCGFIGNVFWLDKNVKVLMPNGKNNDGTLSNLEFVTGDVQIHMITTSEVEEDSTIATAFLAENNIFSWSKDTTFTSYVKPDMNSYKRYFDANRNIWKEAAMSDRYTDRFVCPIADLSINTVGQILSMSPYDVLQLNETKNEPKNEIQIIDTYHNGLSGYRVWSDGFIEQWGHGGTSGKITFAKPFSSTDYVIIPTGLTNAGFWGISVVWGSRTATSVDLKGSATGSTFWYACGF